MERRKLTVEQKNKVFNNLAIIMPLVALVLQIIVVGAPLVIYSINKNWAYLILMLGIELYVMPVLLSICGIIGLICSILALKKICFKIRYVVMIVLSALEVFLAVAFFAAMSRMMFGIL